MTFATYEFSVDGDAQTLRHVVDTVNGRERGDKMVLVHLLGQVVPSRPERAEAAGGPFILRVQGGDQLRIRRGVDCVAEWQGFLCRGLGVISHGRLPG